MPSASRRAPSRSFASCSTPPRRTPPSTLGVLRDRGVVDATRNGNSVRYSLRHEKVLGAIDLLREVMADEFERQHALRQPANARR